MSFQIGDGVVFTGWTVDKDIQSKPPIHVGDIGIVVDISKKSHNPGVSFGHEIKGGHDCNGHCTYGHGFYITPQYLEPLSDFEAVKPVYADDLL